jgi:ribA/ribD-fused uncharacterized protein
LVQFTPHNDQSANLPPIFAADSQIITANITGWPNFVFYNNFTPLMQTVTSFQGDYRFLSNFWPCSIWWQGVLYPTLEHAYAASKTEDPAIKAMIRCCPTPGEAKEYMGAHGIATDPGWTREKKLDIMHGLLLLKFGGREPLLTRALLLTGEAELLEGNDWNDRFWGICAGTGENNLGQLLMRVRQQLRDEKQRIEKHVAGATSHAALAAASGLPAEILYEKMIAFGISQKTLLGYQ